MFAPGHRGELTRFLPVELVDDVLARTRTLQRRVRALPSRTGVYFLLALALFPQLGYQRVWTKLCAGLGGVLGLVARPSEKALRDLRRRLGPAPLRELFEVVAGPLAQPRTAYARDRYRLLTTLLDEHRYPAETLVRLYHERWEIETGYYALRHTMLGGRVLRSQDQAGLEQEVWALLTAYQLLRMAMVEAIESRPGLDPDRASFTTALEAARPGGSPPWRQPATASSPPPASPAPPTPARTTPVRAGCLG